MVSKKQITSFIAASVIGISALGAFNSSNHTQEVQAAVAGQAVTVNANGGQVALRVSPDDNAAATGQNVADNTAWSVVSVATDAKGQVWYNLASSAWIKSSDVVDTNAQAQKLIDTAKAQIGKPYSWGAKGPSAFDCSGLMHYVYQQALGKEIGGYTVAQEGAGQSVAINDMKPGDLVFWGSHGSTYHVALYVGNNQYIDAPKPGQNVDVHTISSYFMPSFGVRVL
ncbi:MAG: C40 family peptidase [Lactobacillus sp.]|jgi:peptidoglycan DL-endopeptidase CwlO|uniref:Glycoside hydrolase n=1 Tax=Bombilactobacillus bombi TaxID=1303590 RepID=A0A347SSY9_9LACO|nr:C40 family peptidase [Bombilactobacillus bombi]MCO6541188.1 C40 family peptidase [Lactobacillus sp.]AXX65148.1 NlpC/P60 family protein [Bombilactobacillus bombi]MCO6543448.1 C40 family peptidase [Lactobacillus sp.]RHW48840.1 glycoside hydrolase [Bombilactobacillus bombi]RHW51119.1 glycoside hydrolase [Bombilactobacillus bombi]